MQRSVNESLLSRTMAARVQIEQRFQQLRDTFPGRWTPDYAVERSIAIRPNITAGRERYARAAAASATEARDPFLDKRVVDYCSRLPGELRMNQGWPKIILRELTAGRLPDEVRWSRGKHHLGWVFNGAVTRLACQQGKLDIDKLRAVLGDYVDSPALDSAWERFVAGEDAQPIHTAYLLSLWLQENSNRPVVPN